MQIPNLRVQKFQNKWYGCSNTNKATTNTDVSSAIIIAEPVNAITANNDQTNYDNRRIWRIARYKGTNVILPARD